MNLANLNLTSENYKWHPKEFNLTLENGNSHQNNFNFSCKDLRNFE